jgi:hypothetical protein
MGGTFGPAPDWHLFYSRLLCRPDLALAGQGWMSWYLAMNYHMPPMADPGTKPLISLRPEQTATIQRVSDRTRSC